MNNTSVNITGKIGYHSFINVDKYTVQNGRPAYTLLLEISDKTLASLKGMEGVVLKDRGGLKAPDGKLKNLGMSGTVIKGLRREVKGPIEVIDGEGNAITGLIGYGSDVIVTGFLSTFTNTNGTFTNFYVDKVTVTNLVEVAPREEGPATIESSKGAII